MESERDDSGPDAAELDAVGAVVDDYAIESLVGGGACGTVYRARGTDGRAVALKVLHAELLPSGEHAHRLAREARALRLLRHPNVVAVEAIGALPSGRPYLVMELLAGRSLEAALAERGRLTPAEIDQLLEPLCDALGAAHALGIVHRDLKPSNVFLAAEPPGRFERVVLLDFGIAKLLDEEGITSARQIIGTPSSIAPEQILGLRVDARTDVYGLGALCHELLTGRPPFAGPPLLLMQQHLHVPPPSASSRAPVAPELDRVLERALAKAPDQRFPDAGAFLAAFRAAAFAPRSRVGRPGDRAVAFHLEVSAPPAVDAARADREAILDLAAGAAAAAGWALLLESGDGLLAARPCADVAARRGAVAWVLELGRAIAARAGAHPETAARLRVHADDAERIEDWSPPGGGTGVLASPAALAGLDLPADGEEDGDLRIGPPIRR